MCNMFVDTGTSGREAGKKPFDKQIEELNGYPAKSSARIIFLPTLAYPHIKKLEREIEELKRENKLLKAKLRRFGEIFDNNKTKKGAK